MDRWYSLCCGALTFRHPIPREGLGLERYFAGRGVTALELNSAVGCADQFPLLAVLLPDLESLAADSFRTVDLTSAIFAQPGLRLRRLAMESCAEAAHLGCAAFPELRELSVRDWDYQRQMPLGVLSNFPQLTVLRVAVVEFHLSACGRFLPPTLREISADNTYHDQPAGASSALPPGLRALSLTNAGSLPLGELHWLLGGLPAGLRSLDLRGTDLAGLSDSYLASWLPPQLEVVDLRRASVREGAVCQVLAARPELTALVSQDDIWLSAGTKRLCRARQADGAARNFLTAVCQSRRQGRCWLPPELWEAVWEFAL